MCIVAREQSRGCVVALGPGGAGWCWGGLADGVAASEG